MAQRAMKKTLFLVLSLCLLSSEASHIPSRARRHLLAAAGTVFDVTTSGAVGDGKTDNTQALMKAWNAACKSAGPATLLIPKGDFACGEVVFQGKCTAPITVEVQGTLVGSSDMSLYTQGVWIAVEDVQDVTINGGGTLNGQGEQAWKFSPKNGGGDVLLPISLQFSKVHNGAITNLKVVNSKGFHTKVTGSANVTVSDLTITAPGDSPNTDGLHISSSSDVTVSNLVIGTGDDCISIGEGNTNIAITNVTCGPGHGISVGSLGKRPDETDVKGVTVKGCKISKTTNGVRIKTYHASPSLVASGIIFEDIVMDSVENPIIIDQHYFSKHVAEPSHVQLTDIHFRNIKGTSSTPIAVTLNCSSAVPCKGVELANINLTPAAGTGDLSAACSSAETLITGPQSVPLDACKAA